MGSNPVEVPKFFRVNLQLLILQITTATIISLFKLCRSLPCIEGSYLDGWTKEYGHLPHMGVLFS